jgi:hypothetical protein
MPITCTAPASMQVSRARSRPAVMAMAAGSAATAVGAGCTCRVSIIQHEQVAADAAHHQRHLPVRAPPVPARSPRECDPPRLGPHGESPAALAGPSATHTSARSWSVAPVSIVTDWQAILQLGSGEHLRGEGEAAPSPLDDVPSSPARSPGYHHVRYSPSKP